MADIETYLPPIALGAAAVLLIGLTAGAGGDPEPLAADPALALAAPVAVALDEAEVKRLALEAILEQPEVVMEAVAILREREAAEAEAAAAVALAESGDLLANDPNAPVLGNPDGDVVLVEFFDYNCGFCRRAAPTVEALIEADPNLKVVMREFPILSEGSVVAARASLAARGQDAYEAFHFALMEGGRLDDEAAVMAAAEAAGLDMDRLRADMALPEVDEHIETSRELATALGINGTPAFVVGDRVIPGAVPFEELTAAIEEAREG